MRRAAAILAAAIALTACSARALLSQDVVRSEMSRNPEASFIDGLQGKLKWNYTTGLELQAMLDMAVQHSLILSPSTPEGEGEGSPSAADAAIPSVASAPNTSKVISDKKGSEGIGHNGLPKAQAAEAAKGSEGIGPYELSSEPFAAGAAGVAGAEVLRYVDTWYDAIIDSTGRIGANYKKANWSLDHICPGRTLFTLYDLTGKQKYRAAADSLYAQLQGQPRTAEGGFWHKKIYPGQMWLDGLYMAQPFYAEYTARYVPDSLKARNFEDIVRQFDLAWSKCYDSATGLLRHAWDSSEPKMFWADPTTGQSAHAWGRALGWYTMALVEVIPFIPKGALQQDLIVKLGTICRNIRKYEDPATGMWYQVLDRPGAEGNYVESTASAMFVYAMLKGCRNGWLQDIDMEHAREKYRALLRTFVSYDPSTGLVNLSDCCAVAGLGGKENRSGTYEYYINEKKCSNDPKGIGPLVWAALEYETL